ncbi:RagB/SusD family nutrient uptake outer membrane protein [Salinibacter ruber]|uniref:RagB/SusD family nutrient uptake outer membrane protein n=1 Tax=Salinibacter ruber TaxID=146919 RepID=UPI00216A31B8|nr:RagB/SusD family nutrient uptake outer membrane protein [Salinibacter ruber]MCS3821830.1 hypothetical protein [Salinibacter ruber]
MIASTNRMIGTMNTAIRRTLLTFGLLIGAVALTACTDVGVNPKSDTTAKNFFTSEGSYKAYFAKLYAGLVVTGQTEGNGGAGSGDPDITVPSNIGFGQYTRLLWNMQELTTESAVTRFQDQGIRDLNNFTWSSQNQFSVGMYNRIYFQVAQVNEFLRQSRDSRLEERAISEQRQEEIQTWRAEARFLRALSLWHGIDLFGKIPVPTTDVTLGDAPEQSSRDSAFAFVERELLRLTDDQGDENLLPAGQAPYGRADRGAAWMLLAKLYQNAPVYLDNPQQQIGEDPSNLVIEYTERLINGPYSLETQRSPEFSAFQHLFLADNHTANGIIFAVPQDGQSQRTYGGTQYLTHANLGTGGTGSGAWSGDPGELVGVDAGYGGMRTTSDGVALFDKDQSGGPLTDDRAIFFTTDQDSVIDNQNSFADGEIDDPIGYFREGWAVIKFKNLTSNGGQGSNPTFPDTDFPMFRLADAYLMYAEAVLRGGQGGSRAEALSLVNDLRMRANVPTIQDADLDLDFLLRERGRELFWEAHRRTDLIRYGEFIDGQWSWKGGVGSGNVQVEECREVFPIAASELRANPNLEQNRDCY